MSDVRCAEREFAFVHIPSALYVGNPKGTVEMTATGYELVAEDFIAMQNEKGHFNVWLCLRLIWRSKELPTAATSDELFADVLDEWVQKDWFALQSFRHRNRNAPNMLGREAPSIVEALKPLCVRAFPMLNGMVMMERDALFQPRDYAKVMGRLYAEEAPSITSTRFLNDMDRLREVRSETFERNVPRIAEVHALHRVANIMPRQFHIGVSGKLEPGQTVEGAKWAEVQRLRDATGIHTLADLLEQAGAA